MKILIVDDHPLFVGGLKQVLEQGLSSAPTFLEATSLHGARQYVAAHGDIDLVFLDLVLPDGGGLELLPELGACPAAPAVAVLTAVDDASTIAAALAAGAIGYVSKASPRDELLTAFGAIRARRRYVSPDLKQRLAAYTARGQDSAGAQLRLTRRQREVLDLLVAGHSNAAIAARLALSESTVKSHVSTLFDVLEVDNRAGCTREALRRGLVG
ncbi:MAG: response regulator transcription factor [Gammaproteobacteria bacterium]